MIKIGKRGFKTDLKNLKSSQIFEPYFGFFFDCPPKKNQRHGTKIWETSDQKDQF